MSDQASQAGGAGARDGIDAALRRFFVERARGSLEADAIDGSRHMFEAGYLDSMNSLALLDLIEDRWGVVVPEVELIGRLAHLDALVAYVAERAAPAS